LTISLYSDTLYHQKNARVVAKVHFTLAGLDNSTYKIVPHGFARGIIRLSLPIVSESH